MCQALMNGWTKGNAHRESRVTQHCSHLSTSVDLVSAEKFAGGKRQGVKEQRTRKNTIVTQSISYFGLLLVTGSEEL